LLMVAGGSSRVPQGRTQARLDPSHELFEGGLVAGDAPGGGEVTPRQLELQQNLDQT
jgi:hypothetical protein